MPNSTPSNGIGGQPKREEVGALRKPQAVTDRELEILKILWAKGRANVREVQEELGRNVGPVAYSTVQTLLNIMEEKKGLVRHVVEGRTFVYIPKKTPEGTLREMTKRFIDRVFDGALDRVMVALLDARAPSPEELARLRAVLDRAATSTQTPSRAHGEAAGETGGLASRPSREVTRSGSDPSSSSNPRACGD